MTTTASRLRTPLGRSLSSRFTLVGIVGFAAAVAAASQIAIPLPWTPVPITLQPMLVILAGMWLGPAA
ncbi:MAG TPA: biotin transporter BioY, partial [Candidatus Binatia bacterium]|nr:biotin transporter BioY [Candidatus Binatia bacterium]